MNERLRVTSDQLKVAEDGKVLMTTAAKAAEERASIAGEIPSAFT